MTIIPQLRQFYKFFGDKLSDKGPCVTSIGTIQLRLPELLNNNVETNKIQLKNIPEVWEYTKGVL